jgi:hypothetical protein
MNSRLNLADVCTLLSRSLQQLALLCFSLLVAWSPLLSSAQEHVLHSFESIRLTDTYFSEGANAGDLNQDGHPDVVYGPYWFEGPDFEKKHAIYEAVPQPMEAYADHFFAWVYDFNRDGWDDVFVVGFPGKPAYVYENPGKLKQDEYWPKHEVFDSVGNESPHFTQIVGDEVPELICTHRGIFGYATFDSSKPFETWTFHPISGRITAMQFGHGLGVGDVNGDGLLDVIYPGGWFQQPSSNDGEGLWTQHKASFSNSYGGAEMYAYDVDGDGDNDIITSQAAHDFGLAWYEQIRGPGEEVIFEERLIMGYRSDQNKYGVVFSEPHSVNLVDMDGDGLKDIVTGKTYYSHHEKSPLWDAGAVAYWFRLQRTPEGVDWIPYLAASDTGIGRQVSVSDVNKDGLPDIVVGGMKGSHVLLHRVRKVAPEIWQKAQPEVYQSKGYVPAGRKEVPVNARTGLAEHALEAESMRIAGLTAGKVVIQDMSSFHADRWSGGKQLFWSGAEPRARLHLEFELDKAGNYQIGASFTTARDYCIINVLLDNRALTEPIDLFGYPDVETTGLLEFGRQSLEAGKHRLTLETIGINPAATKYYMVGMDFLSLKPVD